VSDRHKVMDFYCDCCDERLTGTFRDLDANKWERLRAGEGENGKLRFICVCAFCSDRLAMSRPVLAGLEALFALPAADLPGRGEHSRHGF
jgi:redox-regulated HSP33 family molecular chaperone